MALTELQLPLKGTFYQNIQNLADEIFRCMERWEAAATFLDSMGASDLDDFQVSTTDGVRVDLIDFSVFLSELVDLWNNSGVTPTKNPKNVINEIRRMIVIPF